MITIRRFHLLLRAPLFVLISAIAFSANATHESWDAEQLMQRLSEVTRAQLTFVETKQSLFLVTDVTLAGTMEYRAPDYIEKHTLTPFIEKVVINGDSMTMRKIVKVGKEEGVSQVQEYSVQSHPLLKAAVESIRALLAGNFKILTENYTLELTGTRSEWQLNLAPKSAEILEHIKHINLTGSDIRIREIVTIQADGDESTVTLDYKLLE